MGKHKDSSDSPKEKKEKKEKKSKREPSFIESNRDLSGQIHMHDKLKPKSNSIANQISYWSAGSLVRQGFKAPLVHSDLWRLPEDVRSYTIWDRFEPAWKEELALPKPSLFRALRKVFWKTWATAVLLQLFYGILSFANPIILPYMLRWIADPREEYYWGIVYMVIIFVCGIIGSFLYYYSIFMSNILGLKVRSAMVQSVFRKVLSMSSTKGGTNSGYIVNLVANDTQFLMDTIQAFNNGLTAPIQIIIATGLLSQHINVYCLLAPAIFFITLPFASVLGKRFGTFRGKIQGAADRRLKLTNELINGVRIVKFYAWENAFMKNIEVARDDELKHVRGLGYNRSLLIFVMSNTTTIITAAIFLFYGLFGTPNGELPTPVAFSVLSLLNILRVPFFLLPFTLTLVLQYKVTLDRIQGFILGADATKEGVDLEAEEASARMKDCEFSWNPKDGQTILKDVSFKLKPGSVTMVVGAVGSGKSTLGMALLGEVPMTKGKRSLKGSVAYVSQEAWIVNASVKENILFGEPYNKKKYQAVLDASALGPDLAQLPGGDLTEIGERGINLSGGQKQRVSIARALYSNKKFYIMDDPLSAVDSHVGKHIFEQGVQGYLKGKTIFLVTNQLQFLPQADNIIVLAEGRMVDFGPFKDLMQRCKELQKIMKEFGDVDSKEEKKQEKAKEELTSPKPQAKKATHSKSKGALTGQEDKASGLVGFDIYTYFVKKGGVSTFFIIVALYLFSTACNVGSSWWLSVWTQYGAPGGQLYGPKSQGFLIGIYMAWLAAIAVFNYFAYLIFVPFSATASKNLHTTLLQKVVRAPTAFFDKTPVGRIINRFAKEMSMIDVLLPMQLSLYINAIFSLFAIFAAILFGSPYVAIAIVPMMIFYVFFQYYYRKTSVELQRLEALSRAPILSHLAESLNGVSSIRAYNMTETFKNMNSYKIDFNGATIYALRYCAAWFGLRLDWVGNTLVLLTLLAIVLTRIFAQSTLNPGYAGIAITYLGGITLVLSQLNLNAVETEMRMNSVERIKEYETLPQEAPSHIPETKPPEDWPSKGKVEFKNYSLAYREADKVLDSINVTVKAKEKVGIVGRTGAGKSSLMQALFRMVEPLEGSIIIDGIDITKIGLDDLRSKLAIIPQEPVLFIGTVRYNLDPFEEHDDKEIWEVLRLVHLKKAIADLPKQLDEPVTEHGSNFSVGQRQLICMARALLRKAKILLMDEATASVDQLTDSLIQKMVRKHFKDQTVLTIAHRLNTIMDSTKVMVLDKGQLIEYNEPKKLLENTNGHFTSMVDAVGPTMSQHLRKIAFGELDVISFMRESMDTTSQSTKSDRSDVDFTSSDSDSDSDQKKKKNKNKEESKSDSTDEEEDSKPKKSPKESKKVESPKESKKVESPKESKKVESPKESKKVDSPKESKKDKKVESPKEVKKEDSKKVESPKVVKKEEAKKVESPKVNKTVKEPSSGSSSSTSDSEAQEMKNVKKDSSSDSSTDSSSN